MNNLQVIEFKNQRVLISQQLADAYVTDARRISENFNANKTRYEFGKHYFVLEGEDKREFLNHTEIKDSSKNAKTLYLWTEKGALLHAKSLGTDKAWEVYDQLVESYFSKKEDLLAGMSTEMKALIMQDKKLQVIDQRVDKLESTMTIDYGQQQDLRTIANKIIVTALGGKKSNAYEVMSKTVFAKVWHDFKEYFHVNSYRNTPSTRFEEAQLYLETWEPEINLKLEIAKTNKGVA